MVNLRSLTANKVPSHTYLHSQSDLDLQSQLFSTSTIRNEKKLKELQFFGPKYDHLFLCKMRSLGHVQSFSFSPKFSITLKNPENPKNPEKSPPCTRESLGFCSTKSTNQLLATTSIKILAAGPYRVLTLSIFHNQKRL